MSAGWIPGIDIKPIMEELQRRAREELDYTLEARGPGRVPPRPSTATRTSRSPPWSPTPSTSSSREWLDGTPLSKIIADGTQDERDLAAGRYLEFLLAGPQRAGLLHADPHPGNFRLTPDGRLGVLDFGAVNRLPDGLPEHMGRLLDRALAGDDEAVVAGLREDGFIKPSIDGRRAGAAGLPRAVPGAGARGDASGSPASSCATCSATSTTRGARSGASGLKLNLPPQYLLIHRVWLGGIGVLCQIEGEVPVQAVLSKHLPGFARETVDAGVATLTTRRCPAWPRCCAGSSREQRSQTQTVSPALDARRPGQPPGAVVRRSSLRSSCRRRSR